MTRDDLVARLGLHGSVSDEEIGSSYHQELARVFIREDGELSADERDACVRAAEELLTLYTSFVAARSPASPADEQLDSFLSRIGVSRSADTAEIETAFRRHVVQSNDRSGPAEDRLHTAFVGWRQLDWQPGWASAAATVSKRDDDRRTGLLVFLVLGIFALAFKDDLAWLFKSLLGVFE